MVAPLSAVPFQICWTPLLDKMLLGSRRQTICGVIDRHQQVWIKGLSHTASDEHQGVRAHLRYTIQLTKTCIFFFLTTVHRYRTETPSPYFVIILTGKSCGSVMYHLAFLFDLANQVGACDRITFLDAQMGDLASMWSTYNHFHLHCTHDSDRIALFDN